ncbi:BlaI/MecI/CopY family transcriptional regulator [soil metagenome]
MTPLPLSRRERQIMDIVHRLGRATAADVQDALADAPSNSAVRTHLRILEDKGHLTHLQEGTRYVYRATILREEAQRSALGHVVRTFFDDNPGRALAALVDQSRDALSDADLDRLALLVEQARQNTES